MLFKKVDRAEAQNKNQGDRLPTTKPGVDVFVISGGEASKSKNGNWMIRLEFLQREGKSSFNHTFFLTEGAISRLKSLWLDSGNSEDSFHCLGERDDALTAKYLSGEALNDAEKDEFAQRAASDILEQLKGKLVRLKVIREIKDDVKNNKPEGYIVPTLPFSNFSELVATEPTKLTYNPDKDWKDSRAKTPAASVAPNTPGAGGDDLPF